METAFAAANFADLDLPASTAEVLDSVNALLRERDDELTAGFDRPQQPVVFIVAPPRAASTLFQQLTRSTLSVGCVSNIMARFWMAPYIGAVLEQDMSDPDFVSSLKSYGRHYNPVNAHEPHEWGWFWAHWLQLKPGEFYCPPRHRIDRDGLNRKLAAVQAVKRAPLLFDNVYAMCNLPLLLEAIPRVLLVRIRRSHYYVANSVLNARIDRHGDVSAFFSHKPRNIERLLEIDDPVEQSVAQVHAIATEIDNLIAAVNPDDIFDVDYPDIVGDPHGVMRGFSRFLAKHECSVSMRDPMPEFPQLRNRNHPSYVKPQHSLRLTRHIVNYFGAEHLPS